MSETMSETMPETTPVCPGCDQGDRVTALDPASQLTKHAVAEHGPLAGWFCDRCHAILSSLPATPAGPLPADQRVRVVDDEPTPARRRRKKGRQADG